MPCSIAASCAWHDLWICRWRRAQAYELTPYAAQRDRPESSERRTEDGDDVCRCRPCLVAVWRRCRRHTRPAQSNAAGWQRRICCRGRALRLRQIHADEGGYGLVATHGRRSHRERPRGNRTPEHRWDGFPESNAAAVADDACKRDAAARDRATALLQAEARMGRLSGESTRPPRARRPERF